MTTDDPHVVRVWPFVDAPVDLRALSDNGGGEDWLALVPSADHPALRYGVASWLMWMAAGGDLQRIDLPDGRVVLIGAHT